jgi:hypothetical protein
MQSIVNGACGSGQSVIGSINGDPRQVCAPRYQADRAAAKTEHGSSRLVPGVGEQFERHASCHRILTPPAADSVRRR